MGTCERMLRVDAPADVVWGWMSDPSNLFRVNMLHAEVVLPAGAVDGAERDAAGLSLAVQARSGQRHFDGAKRHLRNPRSPRSSRSRMSAGSSW